MITPAYFYDLDENHKYEIKYIDDIQYQNGHMVAFRMHGRSHCVGPKCVPIRDTFMKDKHGIPIVDGSIVLMDWNYIESSHAVVWQSRTGEWRVDNEIQGRVLGFNLTHVEVVGHVFDGNFVDLKEHWDERQLQFKRMINEHLTPDV